MTKKKKPRKTKPRKKKHVKMCSHLITLLKSLLRLISWIWKTAIKKCAHLTKSKKSRFRRLLWLFWNAIGVAGVCISYWVVVNPNIYVYTSHPLDRSNPVFTPFVTRNQGYLAIHDVKFEWKMNYLITDTGTVIIAQKEFENTFSDPNQVARVIAPGEEYSIRPVFSGLKYNKFEHMDIAIELSFRPFRWWPLRYKRSRRFVTQEGTDGQWYWFPMPFKK